MTMDWKSIGVLVALLATICMAGAGWAQEHDNQQDIQHELYTVSSSQGNADTDPDIEGFRGNVDRDSNWQWITPIITAIMLLLAFGGMWLNLLRRSDTTAKDLRDEIKALDGKVDSTAKDLRQTVENTAREHRGEIKALDGKVDSIAKDLRQTVENTAKDLRDEIKAFDAQLRGKPTD